MWLLLWLTIPIALGKTIGLTTPSDTFLLHAKQEIDLFHRTLFLTDSLPEASNVWKKKTAKKQSQEASEQKNSGLGGTSSKMKKGKSYEVEGGKTRQSEKEKLVKQYKESEGKKGDSIYQGGHSEEFNEAEESGLGRRYKDRLLHKKGNYEKGYRDKYHLDEVVKQSKFWSDNHSQDQFHQFGSNGADFHQTHEHKSKKADTQAKEEKKEDGKKGKSSEGHSKAEHKGHKEAQGKEEKYEHKEEYGKKKSDTNKNSTKQ